MPDRHFKYLLRVFCVVALLTLPVKMVMACSCGPEPSVLDEFEESEVVIIGRVLSVEKVEPKGEDDQHYVDNVRSATLRVEKVYKGNVRVRDELVFAQGGGADCIWTFNEELIGVQILFYLNTPQGEDKLWRGFGCGRSSSVEGATEDLLYLNNMKKLRGKTRVSGSYGFWNGSNFDVANKKIRIVSEKKSFETKTDENGIYEIYDLPPGKYRLEPEMQKGWRIDRSWLKYSASASEFEQNSRRFVVFTLKAKRHASVDVSFEPDNAVEGSVVGPNGSPMVDVCVYLWPPDVSDKFGASDCTDERGNFRIESIPAGSYHLVMGWHGKPDSRAPFPKTFYPGVTDRGKAALITIGDGETVKNINVVIPELVETITVEGVLRYSDDKPVVGKYVYFKSTGTYGSDGDSNDETDAHGMFTIKIIKGVKGVISSEIYSSVGGYPNCPKLDALIKETGQRFATIKSSEVNIQGDQDVFDMILKFPFTACAGMK